MIDSATRRELLRLAGLGIGGAVFSSGLPGCASSRGAVASASDFMFLQLSDTHWGFSGPPNPEAAVTLQRAVAEINQLRRQPDFIVFTGDLTHTTEDPALRRKRMAEFKQIVSELAVKDLKFLPGEHDASLDRGEAFVEAFGPLHQAFDHQGVRFIALDNVSDPSGALGDAQIDWLRVEIRALGPAQSVVVLAHRPLFPLFPSWDWATPDGEKAIDVLQHHPQVSVFYGHIHQEHHHQTGAITHHAARSLIFPLPAPGSVPKRAPLPWDPARPFAGLGYRTIEAAAGSFRAEEHPLLASGGGGPPASTIRITAKKWEYAPNRVTVKRGLPITLELVSLDRLHGFALPELGLRTDISERTTRLELVPPRTGTFAFHCDVFCGEGHEDMTGELVVVP